MSDVLQFTTKPKEETADATAIPPLHAELDGYPLEIRRPKDALLAELAAVNSRRVGALEKIRLCLNFLEDCLVEPGRSHVRTRLLDEDDDLDAEDTMPLLEAIAAHWKANSPQVSRRDRRRR